MEKNVSDKIRRLYELYEQPMYRIAFAKIPVNKRNNKHDYTVGSDTANETLNRLFRADLRTKMRFSEECSSKICTAVCKPGSTKCDKQQENSSRYSCHIREF